MPSADQKPQDNPAFRSMLDRMQPMPAQGLEFEIAALRSEIRELREELAPVSSLILTGRQVLDEFKRLSASELKV